MTITNKDSIRSIGFDRTGTHLAANCTKAIRLFKLKDPAPAALNELLVLKHESTDTVNSWTWSRCCFSRDSQYIVAGVQTDGVQKIYVWDVETGHLKKILEGPRKEGTRAVVWHPLEASFVVLSVSGDIAVWSVNVQESWSAYAPDFKELEENCEYIEREDEFDIKPKETVESKLTSTEEEDILKEEPGPDSDYEDMEGDVYYLPSRPPQSDNNMDIES